MPLHPRTCSFLYSVSCLLDAVDGHVARIFQQSTRFGAVLDMVTDRCTTSCLLVFLSSAFPRWAIVFQGLIALDFSSHYMHMYATLVVSGADSSHKNIDKSKSWLLNLYYTNKASPGLRPALTVLQLLTRAVFLERPLCFLRPQRALLHRPLPAVLLVSFALSSSDPGRQGRWRQIPTGIPRQHVAPQADLPGSLFGRRS